MNNVVRHWRLAKTYASSYLATRTKQSRQDFESVRTMFLFAGYRRSGHSLVGALLDAHPEVLTAHGLDLLRYLRYGFNRDQLFHLIRKNSRERSTTGRMASGYSYAVPNQWQGRYQSLHAVGSVRGGASARRLFEQPERVHQLAERVGMPVKVVHVVRNPYDNISTLALRGRRRTDLESAIADYFHMAEGVARLKAACSADQLIDVHHEPLLEQPRETLTRLCSFLGVSAPEDYLKDCQSIMYDSPRKTRKDAPWNPELIERVEKACQGYDFLRAYRYDM